MNFKAYDSYYDSKINWLNELPEHWVYSRLKHLVSKKAQYGANSEPEMNEDKFDYRYIRITDINDDSSLKEDKVYLNKNDAKDYILDQDDLLFARSGATVGKTYLYNSKEGPCCYAGYLIRYIPNNNIINPKYLLYYSFTKSYSEWIKYISTQATIQNVSAEKYDNLIIPIPPITEQHYITNYLDKQTSKINKIITKNNKLIHLLKEKRDTLINQTVTKGLNPNVPMKDSGIEWIGKIPKHWEVEKIKNIAQVKPSNIDKKSKDNEPSVLLCNYTDVYNTEFITMDLDFMESTASYDQIKKLSLDVDDIIITKDSESADDIGVPAIVTEKLNNVVCGYHLAVIRPNKNIIHPKFLFRSFESEKINKQFKYGANGVTRFGLGTYPINNAYVCQPPINEQSEIAEYLDIENSRIFETIYKIKKHINLLEEYKTSLIHNVVTGKVDVRGENI